MIRVLDSADSTLVECGRQQQQQQRVQPFTMKCLHDNGGDNVLNLLPCSAFMIMGVTMCSTFYHVVPS